MNITKQDYDEITVLELKGELDLDSADQLHNMICDIIATASKAIVLDMNSVGFIDSSGLETLLWARDYCDENRCRLSLAGLDENCLKILEITRLDQQFDRYDELSQAVKSFA